jgi:predicted DCC family thiol-disulfide oxidoreductase YuxK
MANPETEPARGDVWFAYDGDCPVCTHAAHALRIRESVGALHLVNARVDPGHPLIREIGALGLDLDEGMVLKFQDNCYHGQDALHMMALLGSPHGWFNRANGYLFRSKRRAALCYPAMRGVRNLLLRLNGVGPIRNLEPRNPDRPIFQAIFGSDWQRMPQVMRDHYAVRPWSGDRVVVEGHLDVSVSPMVAFMARLTGLLVSRSGKNVPVTVTFASGPASAAFHFDRRFRFPQGDQHFRSRMEHVGGNEVVEFMKWGFGWRAAYSWNEAERKVVLAHRGYVWRILGFNLPVPLALLIGKGHAEEIPLSADSFRMWTRTEHPLLGATFGYEGVFRVTEVTWPNAS